MAQAQSTFTNVKLGARGLQFICSLKWRRISSIRQVPCGETTIAQTYRACVKTAEHVEEDLHRLAQKRLTPCQSQASASSCTVSQSTLGLCYSLRDCTDMLAGAKVCSNELN